MARAIPASRRKCCPSARRFPPAATSARPTDTHAPGLDDDDAIRQKHVTKGRDRQHNAAREIREINDVGIPHEENSRKWLSSEMKFPAETNIAGDDHVSMSRRVCRNLAVGSVRKAHIANVIRDNTGGSQETRQGARKIRIDEEGRHLDGPDLLPSHDIGRVGEGGKNVVFRDSELVSDLVDRRAGGHVAHDDMNGNTRAFDDRLAVVDCGIGNDPRPQSNHRSLPRSNPVPSSQCVMTPIDRAVAWTSRNAPRRFNAASTAIET
jgi:hypothetical protein